MNSKNSSNERIKREYFDYLRHADGKSEQTINQIARSLMRFEDFNRRRSFKTFDQAIAVKFKDQLAQSGLAPATILSALNDLKRFLGWLALRPGFKRAIRRNDIEYLNLPQKAVRAANARVDKSYPTLQMVETVVAGMASNTPIEKRDRALIAFTAITGIRDGAIITLKLKHFDEARKLVLQNPSEVATKASKRIDIFLFPLSGKLEAIFLEWVSYLRNEKLFGMDDPLFPKTMLAHDRNRQLMPADISRSHWANASPMRAIFKAAFEKAGLPKFTPHRFRDMIVSEMYRRQLTVAECKAWSQNLGHEGAMTTLTSYGKLGLDEQGALIRQSSKQEKDILTRTELMKILEAKGV
ncbi:MAG: tyrosine-type recombinase/integrase [Pseudomonadota bacterium]